MREGKPAGGAGRVSRVTYTLLRALRQGRIHRLPGWGSGEGGAQGVRAPRGRAPSMQGAEKIEVKRPMQGVTGSRA
jgi:hypothetical protein